MAELSQINPGGAIDVPRPAYFPRGNAAQSVAQDADQVMGHAAALGRHFLEMRRLTDFNSADAEFTGAADQVTADVMTDPRLRTDPDAARAEVLTRLQKAGGDILQRYPHGDVNGLLARNFEIHAQSRARTAFLSAVGNYEQDVKQRAEASGAAALQTALSAADPADGARAAANHLQLLDALEKMGLHTPGDTQILKAKFNQALAIGQFENFAQAHPAQVLTMTAPPEGIDPEHFDRAQRIAHNALESGQTAVDAAMAKRRGDTELALMQKAAAGEPIGGDLENAMAHGDVSPRFYEAYSGHPYRPASDPIALKSLDDGIMDGHVDRTTVLSAIASGVVNARDAAVLDSKISARDKDLKGELGAAKYRTWGAIESAIRGNLFSDPGTLSEARNKFLAGAATAKTPSDYLELQKRLVDEYAQPPATTRPNPAKAAITAKLTGGRVPLFTGEGPELYGKAFAHNAPFATAGPYQTALSPTEEARFRRWAVSREVPFDVNAKTVDYDMRGFWKNEPAAAAAWKPGMHFPDTYKTPYDTTFSAESRYAVPGTPFVWQGDKLVDRRTGDVVFAPAASER